MRTKYFKESSLSEEGKKNVISLAGLSPAVANQILDWFAAKQSYPRFDSRDVIEIAQITGESGQTLTAPISILVLFINRIVDNDESVTDFYADLKDLNIVPDPPGYATLDIVFSRIPPIAKQFRLYLRCRATEHYGLPVLTGSTMSAAMKPVFSRTFRYGEDSLEEYSPVPIGYCTVVQIELQKADTQEVFSFQVNRDNFDRLIADLLALQAELKVMETLASKIVPKE